MEYRLVDWDMAHKFVQKVNTPLPALDAEQIVDLVASLREKAVVSLGHAIDTTGLEFSKAPELSEILVVDRVSWAKANIAGFESLLNPELFEGSSSSFGVNRMSKILGGQAGVILSFLSTKVLGQYENFSYLSDADNLGNAGRLLLVAPNIFSLAKELEVDIDDFMLWVCIHEQTHRIQFAAAPWLLGYLSERVRELVKLLYCEEETGRGNLFLGNLFSNNTSDEVKNVRQLELVKEISTVMTLLEGHANVIMDAVGSSVIPSVAHIREKFSKRKSSSNILEKFCRKYLALDHKMRQYKDGSVFVNRVVSDIGMSGLNQIFVDQSYLPLEEEISDPKLWVKRIYG